MADNNKKRNNSFRKLFSGSFFSSKSKKKNTNKDSQFLKNGTSSSTSSKNNHYQNPRLVLTEVNKHNKESYGSNERIYENLSVVRCPQSGTDSVSNDVSSHHSSSSTLVSMNTKGIIDHNPNVHVSNISKEYSGYAARPQVPRKPYNEVAHSQSSDEFSNCQYPNIYYHSLEKITDQISPLEKVEIYQAIQPNLNPASVGAEIKRVSTKFLISPKKEAEVLTLQPTRARSLSFENKDILKVSNLKDNKVQDVRKPYNYSAPTSPIALNHKIPNMPKTVSPYEHLRKTMIETEEKRNTLNRPKLHTKSTHSSLLENYNDLHTRTSTSPLYFGKKENSKLDDGEKEKTRQKVEAFYWQKLKAIKQKEDEYLLRQSLKSSVKNTVGDDVFYSNSNCSTPNSFIVEQRSNSLPRGENLYGYSVNQSLCSSTPFTRGTPERRTDTFITNRSNHDKSDLIYRHPEKLMQRSTLPIATTSDKKQIPIFQRGSLTQESRNVNQLTKRVSFEERHVVKSPTGATDISKSDDHKLKITNDNNQLASERLSASMRAPPRPPVRTTSVSVEKSNDIRNMKKYSLPGGSYSIYSESESGSEAGEIQRILQNNAIACKEDDWHGDGTRIDGLLSDGEAGRIPTRGRVSRRDDPRRHTLAGHLYAHPHHHSSHIIDDEPPHGLPRTFPPPPANALLFDDDPGIMSEVETSSTGFRRGGKQRSSLPVVRTPSKTLERPLGLVFLQYRNETKRALLPNEITSIDTVKALFVRSFSKQLTMQYMDSPLVKIYVHDSSKDMFYELEDVRAHLRDIRDRSVLRLFESTDMGGGVFPGAVGVGSLSMPPGAATCSGPSSWDQDQSYFSEPEIDSEYHHHVHKSKAKAPAYYIGGGPAPSTLPRGGTMSGGIRAFSPSATPMPADRSKIPGSGAPAPDKPFRTYIPGSGSERCFPFLPNGPRGPEQLYTIPGGHASDGYMSSPERASARPPYEDPYYTQFLGPAAARPTTTPVIDEEASNGDNIDESYQMYGVNATNTAPRPMPRPTFDSRGNPQGEDMQRLRVEKMERQLANLTGLVQKALQPAGPPTAPRPEFQAYATSPRPTNSDAARFGSNERPPKLGRDKFQKSVSFEKSVSFSDDPPDMNSPKQHSPQHSADTKPTKPAIKSSTLPRTSSQERDRLKPAPPPKPAGLSAQQLSAVMQRAYNVIITPDLYSEINSLQNQSRDLRLEARNLRRSAHTQAAQMRQIMADTITQMGSMVTQVRMEHTDSEITREEEIYRQDMLLLENDLYELEATVERLRGQAANKEARVHMSDIERIAMILSKSSKTVADWKLKFPILQESMKIKLAAEMEKVVRKEKLLEEEPERLEVALRRCKKLTGTLVTLKRLACVQEQRLPMADGRSSPISASACAAALLADECSGDICALPQIHNKGACAGRGAAGGRAGDVRPENALDALLDELQTFTKPGERAGARGEGSLRRLHSYPSGSDAEASPPVRARGQHAPKPPVPERHPELLALAARRAPPPPPPRTTSRSPLASPTTPSSGPQTSEDSDPAPAVSSDPSDEVAPRQSILELRHQELLKKQKALQEQYARLQMIQRNGPTLPPNAQPDLKKTGSESNLLSNMSLNLAPAAVSGSMTHLPACAAATEAPAQAESAATTNKVYETDIL